MMTGKTVLITGANRGIGRALVQEALRQGAARVYAASRQPIAGLDERVVVVDLDVNLFGSFAMVNAFLPKLKASKGAIVNVLSLAGVAALPILPAYSISKAAALSFSQSLRGRLRRDGVSVHVVFPGPVDTEMSATLDVPKASVESVARRILDGVVMGEEEIFPDVAAEALAAGWRAGAVKALEREFAGYVA